MTLEAKMRMFIKNMLWETEVVLEKYDAFLIKICVWLEEKRWKEFLI